MIIFLTDTKQGTKRRIYSRKYDAALFSGFCIKTAGDQLKSKLIVLWIYIRMY